MWPAFLLNLNEKVHIFISILSIVAGNQCSSQVQMMYWSLVSFMVCCDDSVFF